MSFRRYTSALLLLAGALAVTGFGQVQASTGQQWRRITFEGVSVRIPAKWPVIRFSRHPAACPLLDVHAAYLGAPGPRPICPPHALGKTEAVMLSPLTGSVAKPARASMITNSDWATARTIVDQLPRTRVTVIISYRSNRRLALSIQASIRVGTASHAAPAATPRAPAAVKPGPAQGVFIGNGFDACAAPSASAMTHWLSSRYRAVGIYIGGVNRACAQQYLTPAWLKTIEARGWRYFPIYPGPQASCVLAYGDATITTGRAAAEGSAAARDAATQAASLGIPPGTPLIYDMEAYAPACDSQVVTFLNAWDTELHARGYHAGVYESFVNIGALAAGSGRMTEPDVIYYADWDNAATTLSGYMPSAMWTRHQRLHQYRGGHLETHGGVTLDIDSDRLDAQLGRKPIPLNPEFRAALAINANGTAEWFAANASATVVHAWQHPVGSLAFTKARTVGRAPGHIASNPTVVRQPGGALAIFARDSSGHIVHAWQQAGFPNDWEWGSPLAQASRKPRPGTDPASIVLPNGRVEVYQTAATGAILTATQRTANNGFRWTKWGNIKGDCASSPAAATNAAHDVLVFCVTTSGRAAVKSWNGRHWNRWSMAGASPPGLSGTPAVTINGSGQVELIAATTAGAVDYAWQTASGSWTWGTPVPGPGQGVTVTGTPSAITSPSGQTVVFAKLSSGLIGVARQQEGTGSSAFGSWSVVAGAIPGGTVSGSPAGWRNSTGPLGVAVLDGTGKLAISQLSTEGWSEWVELGSGI